jgi:hypothetical protein
VIFSAKNTRRQQMKASFKFRNLKNLIEPTEIIIVRMSLKMKLEDVEGMIRKTPTTNIDIMILITSHILIRLHTFFLNGLIRNRN